MLTFYKMTIPKARLSSEMTLVPTKWRLHTRPCDCLRPTPCTKITVSFKACVGSSGQLFRKLYTNISYPFKYINPWNLIFSSVSFSAIVFEHQRYQLLDNYIDSLPTILQNQTSLIQIFCCSRINCHCSTIQITTLVNYYWVGCCKILSKYFTIFECSSRKT